MKTPEQILLDAAELIEERGWWNGEPQEGLGDPYKDETSPCCALQAIGIVSRKEDMNGEEREDFEEFSFEAEAKLKRFLGVDFLSGWNDAQPDGETVIETLRECAVS